MTNSDFVLVLVSVFIGALVGPLLALGLFYLRDKRRGY